MLDLTFSEAQFLATWLDGSTKPIMQKLKENPQDLIAVAMFMGTLSMEQDMTDDEVREKIEPVLKDCKTIRKKIKEEYGI